MATLEQDPARFFDRHVGPKARVLLINPPVHEKQYHWIRWNQPAELLRLSAWLKARAPTADVRLFDFMQPDAKGAVEKHKVKHTWTGATLDQQLWHFGEPFEAFGRSLTRMLESERWIPDCIVVSSLTSYWHASIEKLLVLICAKLGPRLRDKTTIALYGNYPRFEPDHAALQRHADVAVRGSVDTTGLLPDFQLYAANRPPRFYGLDIDDERVCEHLEACVELQAFQQRRLGGKRRQTITVAYLNDDVCGPRSRLEAIAGFVSAHPKSVVAEGIAGIEPRSMTPLRLAQLKEAGFRSLSVEHARLAGGTLDELAYAPLLEELSAQARSKRSTGAAAPWLASGAVTGFVSIGLPDDDLDALVRTTLTLNQYFHAIILKPFGYSPRLDTATATERRARWGPPAATSPQWFPYAADRGVTRDDYDNLVRWQGVLNKRVKGTTFDFLDSGTVARLVRETLVAESWKPHVDGR